MPNERAFMDQEIIGLSIVTRPNKHYDAIWKFEEEFQQLKYSAETGCYLHRNLNESIYEIPFALEESIASFLQGMQDRHEIEEFFFNDGQIKGNPLDLALIALKKSVIQNCFQSDDVVRHVIEALRKERKWQPEQQKSRQ